MFRGGSVYRYGKFSERSPSGRADIVLAELRHGNRDGFVKALRIDIMEDTFGIGERYAAAGTGHAHECSPDILLLFAYGLAANNSC
jgi:hypothetical protein